MYMQAEQPNSYAAIAGGGCGLGCGCADCRGLGLFESGLDLSGWGWLEYAVVGIGVYALASVLFTTKRGVEYASGAGARRRAAKAKRLRAEADALTRKKK